MTTQLTNAPKLETEVVAYYINLDNPEEQERYQQLKESMDAAGIRLMRVYSCAPSSQKRVESGKVFLETKYLFEDQWNTSGDSPVNPNFRIHNWYEEIVPNKKIRIGHYTVVTDEMTDLLNSVVKCGYCGNHEWASKAEPFCSSCTDSPYLTADELHLLLMLPVSQSFGADRRKKIENGGPELQHHKDVLLDAYHEAQTNLQARVLEKARSDVEEKYQKSLEQITTERDGYRWLLDRGVNVDNCIYYSHTKTFSFGWRHALDEEVKAKLKDKLQSFPFKVTFK